MGKIGFWSYEWLCLKRGLSDFWKFDRDRLGKQLLSLFATIVGVFLLSVYGFNLPSDFKEWAYRILAGIGVAAVLRLLWFVLRAPDRIHSELVSENERLKTGATNQSDVPVFDISAWETVDYLLDESAIGVGKHWHQIVAILQESILLECAPILVWGTRQSNQQHNRILPSVFMTNILVIEQGGASWVGERAGLADALRGQDHNIIYEHIEFWEKQIKERWPRDPSRPTERLREKQLIRGWRWIVDKSYRALAHRSHQLSGGSALAAMMIGHPLWSDLSPLLKEPDVPRDRLSLLQLRNWLMENIDRLEREGIPDAT